MLRIAICDDETSFVSQINSILSAWKPNSSNFSIESFDNGDALIKSHAKSPFDIILLDVVMPMFNGIEVAKELREYDTAVKIIFLTSSPEYAVDSYTVKANNYLLKPIDTVKLCQCLEELFEELSQQSKKSIHIRCANAISKISLSDIEYAEAQNKHTLFTLRSKTSLESIDSFYHHKSMLTLSDGFFQCHRSYIVNINHIDTYTTKEIRMRSGYRIPISRNCQTDFENAYFSYTFKKAGERT